MTSAQDEDDDLLIVMVAELVDECHDGWASDAYAACRIRSGTPGSQRAHRCSNC